MAIDRDDGEERQARVERLIAEFHEAERRRLLRRGIELWNRTERQQRETRPPSPASSRDGNKVN
jgi:hypothetical protein